MENQLQLLERLGIGIERNRQVNKVFQWSVTFVLKRVVRIANTNVMNSEVASVTIMVLDWLLTLDMEVSLMWSTKWNVTKILYFLTRYLPFIDTSVVMYRQFGTVLSAPLCRITYEYAAWTFIIGMGCAELILLLRTYAVWNRDRRLTIGLPLLFVLTWTVGFAVTGVYLSRTSHAVSPVPQLIGCIMVDESNILSACYIDLMVFEALVLSGLLTNSHSTRIGVLALMVIRGISAYRSGGNSQLIRVVYSDGIIYYVYLSALSIFNAIIILRLPSDYVNLLVMMERVIHSVLACRVILHIRELGQIQRRIQQEAFSNESQIYR